MRKVIAICMLLCAIPSMASHIVGGHIELIFVSGFKYRINLVLYFDLVNGSPGARDLNATVHIFRKSDNAEVMVETLPLTSETDVAYTKLKCSTVTPNVKTSRMLYTKVVTLSAEEFSDPQGYYIVWQRCCRNYTITNIQSTIAQSSGQTFYHEFPPVMRNGQRFINSSAQSFIPLRDYACINKKYFAYVSGNDRDGDSLAYSLSDPLDVQTKVAFPPTPPGPYPKVSYINGFSSNNVMKGNPDIDISPRGLFTVTPTVTGLFVFGVLVEEFRNGEKIGVSRREFQIYVGDLCGDEDAPLITAKKATEPTSEYRPDISLTYNNRTPDDERCLQLLVTDPDLYKSSKNFSENIRIEFVNYDFQNPIPVALPTPNSASLFHQDFETSLCFDRCTPVGTYHFGVIAYDDSCPVDLTDTLHVEVIVTPSVSAPPVFITDDKTDVLNEGDVRSYDIEVTEPDNEPIFIGIIPDNFVPANVGMHVDVLEQADGHYRAKLVWDTKCDVYDFRTKTEFLLTVKAGDNECLVGADEQVFNLRVILPGNADPIISTDLPAVQVVEGVDKKVYERLSFNVFGKDTIGNDLLELVAIGDNFAPPDVHASFPGAQARSRVASAFDWLIECNTVDLHEQNEFLFHFVVKDEANKCRLYKADTLSVKVRISPPDNLQPRLTITDSKGNSVLTNASLELAPMETVTWNVTLQDDDVVPMQDTVFLEPVFVTPGSEAELGFTYPPAVGIGSITSQFVWTPACSLISSAPEGEAPVFQFKFRGHDSKCFNQKYDSILVDIEVRDNVYDDSEFLPPNFISPNHDGYNDSFTMIAYDADTGEARNILPSDNCDVAFKQISVFNRWGKLVFTSSSRDFNWTPEVNSTGIYFYTLEYTHKEFKGTITVRD